MQSTTASFLADTQKRVKKHVVSNLPALNDPGWTTHFESGSDEVRRELARLWCACAAQVIGFGRKQQNLWTARDVLSENYAQWAQLQPYLNAADMQHESFQIPELHIGHLMTGVPKVNAGLQELHKLWFGTNSEKLEALLARGKDWKSDLAMFAGNLLPTIAWAAVQLPGATEDHRAAACLLSYRTGFLSARPAQHACAESTAWQHLGGYTKGATHFKLKKSATEETRVYFEKIKDLPHKVHAIVQHSPPRAMAAVFKDMFDFAQKTRGPLAGTVSQASMLGHLCPEGSNAFATLAFWMPAHVGVITMAEQTGLTIDETLSLVKDLPSLPVNTDPALALPLDLSTTSITL